MQMSTRPPYTNHLSLLQEVKCIPYGGSGVLRVDGDGNFGFKDLKGKPELLASVPELIRDGALLRLVEAINRNETGLFSIGCVSGPVEEGNRFRHSGYVEICINSAAAIADARAYFPFWFHFDGLLHRNAFKGKVAFDWELQPATFLEAKAVGFTCSIFVNTHYSKNRDDADATWSEALSILGAFLGSIPQEHADKLYGQ